MRKTIETIEEYDTNGKVTRKTVTETTEDEHPAPITIYPTYPMYPTYPNPWQPSVTYWTSDNVTVRSPGRVEL